jgi:hypothetical protein
MNLETYGQNRSQNTKSQVKCDQNGSQDTESQVRYSQGIVWMAYILGLVTGIIILLLAYLLALLLPAFRNTYTTVVCTFPDKTDS